MTKENREIVFRFEQFDPTHKHSLQLPNGVSGCIPGGDNWSYLGGQFWLTENALTRVYEGDWIVTSQDGKVVVMRNEIFNIYLKDLLS